MSSLRSSSSLTPSSPSNKRLIAQDFFWNHGGTKVILTGTFDNWQKSVMMKPKLGDMTVFSATVFVDPTKDYQFKYVVDDVWRCSLDFPTITDNHGNVNNLLAAVSSVDTNQIISPPPPLPSSSSLLLSSTNGSDAVSRRTSDESDPSNVKILRSDGGKVSGLVNPTEEPPRLKGSLKQQYSQKQMQPSVQNVFQQRI